ncbi:hypothetical protein EOD40_05405 [Flavobacterium sufflavum]|uniref:Carboxypeptidase-like regulatory domain-containing protein n=1 Tax=Flavobacterium sufflavum TaxID=1921138 RepID=A0A437L0Y9_9FLAO|nr:hypothetical protein [Flavobacterium sufflavum]RVT78671.1 hypothetical protein EOD40_05405 [Flavobacterium sufflavum]
MNRFLATFFILFTTVVLGQLKKSTEIKGQLNAYGSNLEGVFVINLKSEQTVFTNETGYFVIKASVGDTLVFSGLQFKRKEVVLCAEDFQKIILDVHLVTMVHQLDEVVVRNYNSINAASLGIIPSNQRKYTQAERKLKTATDLNPSASLSGMAGGSISADPLINLLSGRTAMLKKELEVEKKESYIAMLEKMFEKEHFINRLQLPLDYVKGFKYYVMDNQKFTKVLEMNNKTTIEFLLGELAEKYKAIIACENE